MIRKLLVLFGIVEVLIPGPIIDVCERIGLENPEKARLRPRANLLARLEGVAFVWLLVRGRTPLVSALLATIGSVAVLRPEPLIRVSQSVAYENPTELELRPWIKPATRLLGVVYLLVVFLSGTAEKASEKRDP